MTEEEGRNVNGEEQVERTQRPGGRGRGGSMVSLIVGALVLGVGAMLVMTVSVPQGHRITSEAAAAEKGDKNKSKSKGKSASSSAGNKNMEPLPLVLPNPIFAGTPQQVPDDVRIDKKRLGKRRPTFVAPKGVKNVAKGKPVTTSDPFPIIGNVDLVTDGDKEALDGRYVELAPGKQHVTIDLEKKYRICAIFMWHNHMSPRVYRDVVVQLSNDPDFVDPKTVYNNDHDNSSGFGVGENYEYFESDEGEIVANYERKNNRFVMTEPLGDYRYVRLWSNGSTANDQNHYVEVEVWALPAGGGSFAKKSGK